MVFLQRNYEKNSFSIQTGLIFTGTTEILTFFPSFLLSPTFVTQGFFSSKGDEIFTGNKPMNTSCKMTIPKKNNLV